MTGSPARLVVLASGNGSNFQAIADASAAGVLEATVAGVVCNRPGAFVLQRAEAAGVAMCVLPALAGEERVAYDHRLAAAAGEFAPDLVVLAGWMRMLSMTFLSAFAGRVVNLHPALPGEFPGTHSIERALDAARVTGLRRTGVMVHFVPDEGMDDGPVIATAEVEIRGDDTIDTLSDRVHATERTLLIAALRSVLGAPGSAG